MPQSIRHSIIFMELCHLGISNRKCHWKFPAETVSESIGLYVFEKVATINFQTRKVFTGSTTMKMKAEPNSSAGRTGEKSNC